MKPQLGVSGVLQVSTHIVLLNLDYLLQVSALSFLLFYVFNEVLSATPVSSPISLLGTLFILFLITPNDRQLLARRSNPAYHHFMANFCFAIFSISSAVQIAAEFAPAAIVTVCRNFVILAVLGVIAGAVYTIGTICSLDKCHTNVGESRRWVTDLIGWSIYMVQVCKWVAGVTFWVAFIVCFLEMGGRSYFLGKSDVLNAIWRWVAAGVSVGLLPLLFLCAMSTHAALYRSCTSHLKNLSVDTLISQTDSSFASIGEESTS